MIVVKSRDKVNHLIEQQGTQAVVLDRAIEEQRKDLLDTLEGSYTATKISI